MRYLVAALLAWVAAQSLKYIFMFMGRNRRIFQGNPRGVWMLSGGMPSAHSATMMALVTVIGLGEGLDSAIFAVSLLLASIVMYDAMMVRYSSGRQGDTLNQLISEQKSKLKQVRVAHGHTVAEVAAGAIVGVIIGFVVFFTMK